MLDLRAGTLVQAHGSLRREDYPPLISPLCADATPEHMLASLAQMPGIRVIYLADLDALAGRPAQLAHLLALAAQHPRFEFWCDIGLTGLPALEALPLLPNFKPVLASETWSGSLPEASELARCVISLDQRAGHDIGQAKLCVPASAELAVILMCLDRMGSPEGPDFARLARNMPSLPGHRCFLAGGIRDEDDVAQAARLGAAGVLVATALHDGRIRLR